MSDLQERYSDVLASYKCYKKLDIRGKLIEQWELIDNKWVDVTEREKAKEELIAAQEEVEKEKALERKMQILQKRQEERIPAYVSCPVCGSHAIKHNTKSLNYRYICEDCNKKFNGEWQ